MAGRRSDHEDSKPTLDKAQRERRPPPRRRDIGPGGDIVELASQDSFPASDPPSRTPVTRDGRPRR